MRAASTRQRVASGLARDHTADARDEVARRRDEVSAARDLASAVRDSLADALDAEIERLEHEQPGEERLPPAGGHARLRAARARRLVARARSQAAAQRRVAAEDRAHAANDRELAALDRLAYAKELANAEVDEVTGALRRRIGLAALQREMDRTDRAGEALTIVFIDVDGLKHVNDELGHGAGDALLRTVVRCVMDEFRSYDLIFRFGGDEFVCSLAGDGLDGVASRFERIAARVRRGGSRRDHQHRRVRATPARHRTDADRARRQRDDCGTAHPQRVTPTAMTSAAPGRGCAGAG